MKFFGNLFIIFSLIPWVSFGTNNLDSQPWPLLAAIAFLATCKSIVWPKATSAVVACIGVGFALAAFASNDAFGPATVRALVNYASIPIFLVAYCTYFKRYGIPTRIMIYMTFIWLAVAISELINPALSEFLSARRTTADRGVTSLSPEPTYYGAYLFYTSWVMLIFYKINKKRSLLISAGISAISVFALARSSMIALYYVASVAVFAISKSTKSVFTLQMEARTLRILLCVVAAVAMSFVLIDFSETGRIGMILERAFDIGPVAVFMVDASINQRMEAPVMSIVGASHNWFFPGGFDTFVERKNIFEGEWARIFFYPTLSDKIMSWVGAPIYELGFTGVLMIFFLFSTIFRRANATEISVLALSLIGAVPLASPLPLLLISAIYMRSKLAGQ